VGGEVGEEGRRGGGEEGRRGGEEGGGVLCENGYTREWINDCTRVCNNESVGSGCMSEDWNESVCSVQCAVCSLQFAVRDDGARYANVRSMRVVTGQYAACED
jgi:hypothetical protein